jgi:hypothetical protein
MSLRRRPAAAFPKTQTPHRLPLQLATHSGVSTSWPNSSNFLKTRMNQVLAPGMAFLDSENPNHYGPRGFKQGRQHLDLLATPQCQTRGF